TDPETGAKPVIWEKWNEFLGEADALEFEALKLKSVLSVAPSHIQRYFEAAETVVDLAFTPSKSETHRPTAGEGKRRLLQLGEAWNFIHLKRPGHYRFKIHASGMPAFTGRVPRLSLWHNHHKRSFAGVDLKTTETEPDTIVFDGLFPAGGYAIRNHARSQNHPNGALKLFRNETIDAKQRVSSLRGGFKAFRTKIVDEEGRPVMPLLLVDWVEVEGPLTTDADRAKRDGLFPEKDADSKTVLASLRRFAERAWRRPVSEGEVAPYQKFVEAERKAGEAFGSAYRSALAALLVSRSFFHLEEGDPQQNRLEVTDFELASRLSYFLWSSMPDEALFDTARKGELRNPKRLAVELDRMIASPKIDRFLESFTKQWLQLHRVGMFQPDPRLYPRYDPWLEESLILETTAYVAGMFRENLPLRELVDSNWTMLNSRLAIHYDLPAPETLGFTKVVLSPQSRRGGILTHGSILSLTSDGTRHRPVHRGAWLSEVLFARTPPPPPPNVEPLEPTPKDQPKTTIRSQLEAHATTPNCVSCHAKIDPLGLAFENFDAIGRWRETERVESGTGANPRVDASGVLPDGRKFSGPDEFKRLLGENDRRLAEAFAEQLATYALRRVMTIDDLPHLRAIVEKAQPGGYRMRSLVRELVLSELFRRR
ncbi:MAG: DUF1592 domain-containing protein, partial [Planctomycetota bacterium]